MNDAGIGAALAPRPLDSTRDNSGSASVAIVVLNWNGRDDTIECLESLRRLEYPRFGVVVVDNGSTDGSVAAIKGRFPEVVVLETGANLGYAGGNNVGIKWALAKTAEYILLLNNDTVVARDMLSELVSAAATVPEGSVIGPPIFYYDKPDRLCFLGARWSNEYGGFRYEGGGKQLEHGVPRIREVDYVNGCALMAGRSVFEEVGQLDEAFFLTYEETDWCYRARRHGHRCFVATSAKVWHKVSASFGGAKSPLIVYFMTRNKLLWARKHLPVSQRIRLHLAAVRDALQLFAPPLPLRQAWPPTPRRLLWLGASWVRQRGDRLRDPGNRAFLRGLFDYYRRKFGDCPPELRRPR